MPKSCQAHSTSTWPYRSPHTHNPFWVFAKNLHENTGMSSNMGGEHSVIDGVHYARLD